MFLRTLWVWLLGLPVTAVLFMLVLLSLLVDREGRMVHKIGSLWCRIILLLSGVRVFVRGVENLPKGRPVIILSNHQGAFDIPVLQSYIPVEFRWVAKKSLFNIPVVGWSMSLAGYVSIERENAGKARRSLEEASGKIKMGLPVLIFPEGTRSSEGLLPFKMGAFLLAEKSGMDIVPVGVKGTRDIMKKGSLRITPAVVTLNIGESIPSAGARELRLRTREAIEGLLR